MNRRTLWQWTLFTGMLTMRTLAQFPLQEYVTDPNGADWTIPPDEGPVAGRQNGFFFTERDLRIGTFLLSGKVERATASVLVLRHGGNNWGSRTWALTRVDGPASPPDSLPPPPTGKLRSHQVAFGALGPMRERGEFEMLVIGRVLEVDRKRERFVVEVNFEGGPVTMSMEVTDKEEGRFPTHYSILYGPHWRHTLDLYLPENTGGSKVPLVVYIHGGGWNAFDKNNRTFKEVEPYLKNGIAFASVNYRYVSDSREAIAVHPPIAAPMMDSVRALQFLRLHADRLGIDGKRVGLTGGSAGACTSLWIGLHDDMAMPDSPDPVAQQSTRVSAILAVEPQTSLDPAQMREWIPSITYGGHAFLSAKESRENRGRDRLFEAFLARREELLPYIQAFSPYAQASKDDPSVYLKFNARTNTLPATDHRHATHHPKFGEMLHQRLRELGVQSWFVAKNQRADDYTRPFEADFFLDLFSAP